METTVTMCSPELQEFIELNAIGLQELLLTDPENLIQYDGFTWRIMAEVLTLSQFEE